MIWAKLRLIEAYDQLTLITIPWLTDSPSLEPGYKYPGRDKRVFRVLAENLKIGAVLWIDHTA